MLNGINSAFKNKEKINNLTKYSFYNTENLSYKQGDYYLFENALVEMNESLLNNPFPDFLKAFDDAYKK